MCLYEFFATVLISTLSFQETIEEVVTTEACVQTLQATTDELKTYTTHKTLYVYETIITEYITRYQSCRMTLQERQTSLKEEIADAEKFTELTTTVATKEKQVDSLLKEIREANENDPHAVNEALKQAQTVLVIIEEIIETIVIIEEILVIITRRCKGYPQILEIIETTTTYYTSSKQKLVRQKDAVKDEQKRKLAAQQKNKSQSQNITSTSDWLKHVQCKTIMFTPVSVKFATLKPQDEQINVSR